MSGCIIQCPWKLRQQEDGHRIADRPAWKKQSERISFKDAKTWSTQTKNNRYPPTRPRLQCGGTLCNRLKLGVSPQSCSSKDKKTKKENRRWRLTPTGSRQSSAKQILLQLAQKVSAFYFYCCHVQSSPLRIGSPPPTPQPFRSSCRLSISILHSEPPLLSLTQRGLA